MVPLLVLSVDENPHSVIDTRETTGGGHDPFLDIPQIILDLDVLSACRPRFKDFQ